MDAAGAYGMRSRLGAGFASVEHAPGAPCFTETTAKPISCTILARLGEKDSPLRIPVRFGP